MAPNIVMLCTGNAARSVMAEVMLKEAGVDAVVTSAGTLVVENQPLGMRTKAALIEVGLPVHAHRSRQITDAALERAHLVVAMAAEHVNYVRVRHGAAADRIATISWLCEHLAPGPEPLANRIAALRLGSVPLEDQGDVADPAGGGPTEYSVCVKHLVELCGRFAPLV